MAKLFLQDLANVESGIYPLPEDHDGSLSTLIARSRLFFADLPEIHRRRERRAYNEVLNQKTRGKRPRYYLQNFHFQSGGWMTDDSADRYDTQVEVFLNGTANAMRRQALRPLLAFRRAGFTLAIIDTPATHSALSLSAISVSNMCLIPARPSPADIEATLPTLGAVRKLGKPFAFVLNQAPPRGYRLSEAATALNAAGVLALPYIVQRNDHQDALGAGFGVTEFAPDGLAAQEILGLWQFVWKRMKAKAIVGEQIPIRATG